MSRLVSTSTRSMRFRWQIVSKPLVEAAPWPRRYAAADPVGLGQQLLGDLQADELGHPVELEGQLVVVHDLEEHDFVAAVAHLLQGGFQRRPGR